VERKMARKLKSSSLGEFSSKLIRFHKLPNGTEIRLYRKKTERRVRSDFTVKRKSINSKNVEKLDNSMNVRNFLDMARDLLSTDIEARGFEMQLFAPNGSKINGNTLLGNVRNFEPRITEDQDEDEDGAFDLFMTLLENCGLDDISLRQAMKLYKQLNGILGDSLDSLLLKNEGKILSASL
jgi:hypothetical protein